MFFALLSLAVAETNFPKMIRQYQDYYQTLDYLSGKALQLDDCNNIEYYNIYIKGHYLSNKVEEYNENISDYIESAPDKALYSFGQLLHGRSNPGNLEILKPFIKQTLESVKSGDRNLSAPEMNKIYHSLFSLINQPQRAIYKSQPSEWVINEVNDVFDAGETLSRSRRPEFMIKPGYMKVAMVNHAKTPYLVQMDSFLKKGEIILTFDDGPTTINNRTAQVTEGLKEFNYPAIFFTLGSKIGVKGSALINNENIAGSSVAIHGYYHATPKGHPFTAYKNYSTILNQLRKTSDIIKSATGVTPKFFRPPYGVFRTEDLKNVIKDLGVVPVGWTIDSMDWNTKDSDVLYKNVKKLIRKRGKGILLMHDIHPQSVRTFLRLRSWLRDNGYTVVSPNRLIEAFNN